MVLVYILSALAVLWAGQTLFFYTFLVVQVNFGVDVLWAFLVVFLVGLVFVVWFVVQGYFDWKLRERNRLTQAAQAEAEERAYEKSIGL